MIRDVQLTVKRRGRGANDQRPTTKDEAATTLRCRRSERGYILLMLMLFVTLLAIAAAVVAPSIAFRVKRDREEEMIHRGVQYSRAIRRYVKKTGRYPARLEELENTNNVRFLRRRYKDPITGKDFKLLHVGEVQLTSAPGIAGATPVANMASPAGGAGVLGGAGTLGGAGALLGAAAAQTTLGAAASASKTTADAAGGVAADVGSGDAAGDAASGDSSKPDSSKDDSSSSSGGIGSGQLSNTVFGGGPIVGVASTSKAKSIREFNHKNRYNQWQFIYDPTMDRGGLITTPAQPALQSAVSLQPQNSSSPNSSGTSSSFGGMQSSSPQQPLQTPQTPPQ